jgi:pimeloyl-ACP methyl ester carboxylesterase
LENRGRLYDGGVDWEGTLWRVKGDNLLNFLPQALRGDPAGAGFAPGSEFLWPFHRQYYWELTQQLYQKELDPSYEGAAADYDYDARKPYAAVARIALTGRITKPLITIHGTLDSLLPISRDSDVYARMVGPHRPFRYHRVEGGNHLDSLVDVHPDVLMASLRSAARSPDAAAFPRSGRFAPAAPPGDGTPSRLKPLLPVFRDSLAELERWVSP